MWCAARPGGAPHAPLSTFSPVSTATASPLETTQTRITFGRIVARRRRLAPYAFLLPFALFFVCFVVLPIGYAIWESLLRPHRSGLGFGPLTEKFSGLANYSHAIHDPELYAGLRRVLEYGVVQIPIMLILAAIYALVIDAPRVRFRNVYRLIFFIPFAVPSVIAAMMWGYLYQPSLSPISRTVTALGFGAPPLLSSSWILWSIVNVAIWQWTGYMMIIIYSSLRAIPGELYEAARIEGAGELRIARDIKVPLIAPALVMTGLFSLIGTLQLFNEPKVIAGITSSISSAFTPNLYIYTIAFLRYDSDYAAAVAVVLALVTCVLAALLLRVVRRKAGL